MKLSRSLLVILFICYCFKSYATNSMSLKLLGSFPLVSEEWLIEERDVVKLDHKRNIWVLSYEDCTLMEFDQFGNLLGKYSREGQGPNELLNPTGFCVGHGKIAVINKHGHELKIFRREKGTLVETSNFSSPVSNLGDVEFRSPTSLVLLRWCSPFWDLQTGKNENLLAIWNLNHKYLEELPLHISPNEDSGYKMILGELGTGRLSTSGKYILAAYDNSESVYLIRDGDEKSVHQIQLKGEQNLPKNTGHFRDRVKDGIRQRQIVVEKRIRLLPFFYIERPAIWIEIWDDQSTGPISSCLFAQDSIQDTAGVFQEVATTNQLKGLITRAACGNLVVLTDENNLYVFEMP